jgi:hypothetical protein
MSNKKLREGQTVGFGKGNKAIAAPYGAEGKALKGKVTPVKQPLKAKQPKGGY